MEPLPLDALEQARSVADLLRVLAQALTAALGAEACLVSRAFGDMLVDLVEHSPGHSIPGGHGYLISDYPATQRVLERGRPESILVSDPDADAREVELLERLGFQSLLMIPISIDSERWGLVEVYRAERFSDADVRRVEPLVTRTAELIPELATSG